MAGEDDVVSSAPTWPELLPWQRTAAVESMRGRATWPHALLVTGARGIGKRTLALNFARALLCESPLADGLACGICASCRYVHAGQHPDLMLIELFERDDDGDVKVLDTIPVDAVRALNRWASVTAHRRRAKVAVIAPAESLHPAAANALLKTLEEPPPDTFLMLASHQPGRVPATLRSRCRRLPAPVPERAAARQWLAERGIADPDCVLAQADGAPLRALELAHPVWQEERAAWLTALSKPKTLSAVGLAARLDAAPKDERKERLGLAIDWLAGWTADLGRIAAGGAAQRNPDFATPLSGLATAVAPISLFRYHRSVLRQRALVAHPLQPRLVAESLLLEYRDLFR